MPFLPDEHSTDKLLKNLGIDLLALFSIAELTTFGWFQYRDHDYLRTLVSTEFAAHAFLYLSFDANGSWRRDPKVVAAIIAFMGRYYQTIPQPQEVMRLKQLMDAKPFNPQPITGWFHGLYPPDPVPR